jgi:hypothetical protein
MRNAVIYAPRRGHPQHTRAQHHTHDTQPPRQASHPINPSHPRQHPPHLKGCGARAQNPSPTPNNKQTKPSPNNHAVNTPYATGTPFSSTSFTAIPVRLAPDPNAFRPDLIDLIVNKPNCKIQIVLLVLVNRSSFFNVSMLSPAFSTFPATRTSATVVPSTLSSLSYWLFPNRKTQPS